MATPDLFCAVAIELGLLGEAEAREAVTLQRSMQESGDHKLVGVLMVEEGHMTSDQVLRVLTVCRARQEGGAVGEETVQDLDVPDDLRR